MIELSPVFINNHSASSLQEQRYYSNTILTPGGGLCRKELVTGEAVALVYMCDGVWAVLEGEVFTPDVFGADFLSPFTGAGGGGATLCNNNNNILQNVLKSLRQHQIKALRY